jgi:NADH-quinone oxidoreductase subunit H
LSQFTLPWNPVAERRNYRFPSKAIGAAIALVIFALIGSWISSSWFGGHPIGQLLLIVGPLVTAALALLAAIVVKSWPAVQRMLLRTAGMILLGAVVGGCLAVWAVALLFGWVTGDLIPRAADPAVTTLFGGPLTLGEIMAAHAWMPGWVALLIWPLQFPLIRDITGLAGLLGFFNLIPIYTIWWERKVAGRIQSRLGPMRVGGWHGWAQSFADGIKLLLKEDLIPAGADRPLFRLAPYLNVIPTALAFLALPFGATYVFRELDVGLLFILGVLGIEVVGVIMAGWASNNKWSVYGAMREACQMVSYEIPMGMALLVPVVAVGTLNLVQLGEAQSGGWFHWLAFQNPFLFLAFVSYFIASLASCKRAPFDLPEAESELVAGFHTEYSGIRWSFFFFAEYAAMFVVSGLAVIVFLGGWHSPLPASWGDRLGDGILAEGLRGLLFSGPIWFVIKCVFFLYIQLWLRWTLPRIRIDQVLYGCVQVLLPLTMILLLGSTLWVWADSSDSQAWATFAGVVSVILGLIGAAFMLGFFAIAAYGFYHRRRLVGNLVQDVTPGG